MDKFTIRKLDGYTIMPNKPLRDKSLSYGARGLLGFMLTLPEDWDYSFNGLVKVSKEGKAAVRTLINELKEAKYIKISQFRNEKGYYQYNYEVYEIPYDMLVKTANNPTPDFQTTDERNSDNQQQINTKRINTNQQIDKIDKNDKTKHKALINELVRLDYIKEDDVIRWRKRNNLEFIQCACRFTENCSLDENDPGDSKRKEMKILVRKLKERYENIDINIFKSMQNVNLDTLISYRKGDEVHHFLDNY